MKIAIFSPTSTIITPTSLTDRPLGGADQALLRMCYALSAKHEVSAFVPVKEISLHSGVRFYPFMDAFSSEDLEVDVLIMYRKVWAMPPIKAKKKVFYSQDTFDTPCFNGTNKNGATDVLKQFDKIVVLSQFHKDNIRANLNYCSDDRFMIIGNAAEKQYSIIKEPLTFVYCSTPFRGLVVLMKMWKKIIERYPTAKLYVFSSMKIYDGEMLDKMQFNKIYDSLKEMTGVIYSGSIPQREVLDRLKHSYALLYPNTYPETYCNVIMEARACRTPFITSDLGALKETGGNAGLYVKGSAYSEEYQEKFLNKLFSLVDNEPLYAAIKDECYPIRTWDDYSEDLERLLKGLKIKD